VISYDDAKRRICKILCYRRNNVKANYRYENIYESSNHRVLERIVHIHHIYVVFPKTHFTFRILYTYIRIIHTHTHTHTHARARAHTQNITIIYALLAIYFFYM